MSIHATRWSCSCASAAPGNSPSPKHFSKKTSKKFSIFFLNLFSKNIVSFKKAFFEKKKWIVFKNCFGKNSKNLKIEIDTVEEDMTKLKTDLEEKMKELQESIDKQIKLTLANPLAQMNK